MHGLIASLLMETNWLIFLKAKNMLLKENEDLLENAGYSEEIKF